MCVSIDLERQNPALLRIEQSEREILNACGERLRSDPGFSHSTLFGFAIGKRSLGISNGFRAMVEHRNTACALPLVRLQVDSALRLHAGELVKDSEAFCAAVMGGEQINHFKDRHKQPLKDAVLVSSLAKRHPWLKEVYKQTSGGVHFSDRHIFDLFRMVDGGETTGDFRLFISPNDHDRNLAYYAEPMACMAHLNSIIACDLNRWLQQDTKSSIAHHSL